MVASRRVLIVTAGLAVGVGCSRPPDASDPSALNEAPRQVQPTAPAPRMETAPQDASQGSNLQPQMKPDAAAGVPARTTDETQMTDGQLFAVLDAANAKEIETAEIAQ